MSRTMFDSVSEGLPLLETRRPISSNVQRSEGAGCIGVRKSEQDRCPIRIVQSGLISARTIDDSDEYVTKDGESNEFVSCSAFATARAGRRNCRHGNDMTPDDRSVANGASLAGISACVTQKWSIKFAATSTRRRRWN